MLKKPLFGFLQTEIIRKFKLMCMDKAQLQEDAAKRVGKTDK